MRKPRFRDHYRVSLNDVERIFREYDKNVGSYPEDEYQGWEMFTVLVREVVGQELGPKAESDWLSDEPVDDEGDA